jgi:hypothetical protein
MPRTCPTCNGSRRAQRSVSRAWLQALPGFRGTQNHDCAYGKWGLLYSLRTRFPESLAGRKAGCRQDCLPHMA